MKEKKYRVPQENEDVADKRYALKEQSRKYKFTRKQSSLFEKMKQDLQSFS